MHYSRYEGMGRTVCEPLACERPVAGTGADGVLEVIVSGERGGVLAPPGYPEALARAACQLLGDGELAYRLARAGRECVEQHLAAETMVAAIAATYLDFPNDTRAREHAG